MGHLTVEEEHDYQGMSLHFLQFLGIMVVIGVCASIYIKIRNRNGQIPHKKLFRFPQ